VFEVPVPPSIDMSPPATPAPPDSVKIPPLLLGSCDDVEPAVIVVAAPDKETPIPGEIDIGPEESKSLAPEVTITDPVDETLDEPVFRAIVPSF